MNNESKTTEVVSLASIIAILREEIEMAFRWDRPSILFAIYSDSDSRKTAQARIVAELLDCDIDQIVYQVEYDRNNDFSALLEQIKGTRTVLSIDPLYSNTRESQVAKLITIMDSHKNRIIDFHTKMIVWLTNEESILFAHQAPDLWSSRHRVVELTSNEMKNPAIVKTIDLDREDGAEGLYNFHDPILGLDSKIQNYLGSAATAWNSGEIEKAASFVEMAKSIATSSSNKSAKLYCLKAEYFLRADSGSDMDAATILDQIKDLEASGLINYASKNQHPSMSVVHATRQSESSSTALSKALELRATGNVSEAINSLVEFTKLDPDADEIWFELGNFYAELNIIDRAVVAYEKVSEDYLTRIKGVQKMAECLSTIGDFDKALELYKKIIRISGDVDEVQLAWTKIGDIYRKSSGIDNAIAAYSMADQAKPAISESNSFHSIDSTKLTAEMWNEIGNIFVRTNDLVEAEKAYTKSIELKPENATAVANLGILYSTMGKPTQAINSFHRAIELFDDAFGQSSIWNLIGDEYRMLGKYPEAITAYTTADQTIKNSISSNGSNYADQLFSSLTQFAR